MSFFPIGRWFSGLVILMTVWFAYGIFDPVLDVNFRQVITDNFSDNPFVEEILDYVVYNFWIGAFILFGGTMFWMLIAGVPFTTEQERIG